MHDTATQETFLEDDEPLEFPADMMPFLQRAMRFAQLVDGAPARCRRQDCRRLGHCHLRLGGTVEKACGAGVRPRAVRRAAQMVVFVMLWLDEVNRERLAAEEAERARRGW